MKMKFDGSITKNPGGKASCGYVIYSDDGKLLSKGGQVIGEGEGMTINIAEYAGLVMGLRDAVQLLEEDERLVVQGDSQLVINQMRLEWRIKKAHLREYWEQAMELIMGRDVEFEWIPRDQNIDADVMVSR